MTGDICLDIWVGQSYSVRELVDLRVLVMVILLGKWGQITGYIQGDSQVSFFFLWVS